MANATLEPKSFACTLAPPPPPSEFWECARSGLETALPSGQYPATAKGFPGAGSAGWGAWKVLQKPVAFQEQGVSGLEFSAQAPYQEQSPSTGMSFMKSGVVSLHGVVGVMPAGVGGAGPHGEGFLRLDFTTPPGPPYWLAAISESLVLATVEAVAAAIRDRMGAGGLEMVKGSWTPPNAAAPTTF